MGAQSAPEILCTSNILQAMDNVQLRAPKMNAKKKYTGETGITEHKCYTKMGEVSVQSSRTLSG
jgi:hypothetical protein